MHLESTCDRFTTLDNNQTHLDRLHRRGLTDHAHHVLLCALHRLAGLSHRPSHPLPPRPSCFGGHRGRAHWSVRLGVACFAVLVTIEGLLALRTLGHVVALLSTAEAFEDVDPHGLAAGLFHRLLMQGRVVVRDVCTDGKNGGAGAGVGIARGSIARLHGGIIGRVGVAIHRVSLDFFIRGAAVCVLHCLRIGLEELALFLVATPPCGQLARSVAILPLPAPGAQEQRLGGGQSPAVAALIHFAVVL